MNMWKNRICGYSEEDPQALLSHPCNFRVHGEAQTAAMEGSLSTVGIVQNVVVSKRTNRILDGHLRVGLAVRDKQPRVPVTWVDLEPHEEDAVLATMDPIGAMAEIDQAKLDELLASVEIVDPALTDMLDSMRETAGAATFQDVEGEDGDGASRKRNLGDKAAQMKPVLYIDQVQVLERALRVTGERNRGKALIMICEYYLHENHPEGQLDI